MKEVLFSCTRANAHTCKHNTHQAKRPFYMFITRTHAHAYFFTHPRTHTHTQETFLFLSTPESKAMIDQWAIERAKKQTVIDKMDKKRKVYYLRHASLAADILYTGVLRPPFSLMYYV